MLTKNSILNIKDNTLPLMAGERSERLAELINQEPAALSTANIAILTDYYQLEVIERVLRQVLPERLDVTISIISKRWQIDVDDHMAHVVSYEPKSRCFIPYTEDLPAKLQEMKQRILRHRELEQGFQQDLQALLAMHDVNSTQTQSTPEPAIVKNHTDAPQFSEGDEAPPVEPEYHMADLPYDVKGIFTFDDDVTFSIFMKCMHKAKEWISSHNKQDWNVVKFVLILRNVLARKTTMKLFAKLLLKLFPGIDDQEGNMKHRPDANDADNYERYDDPQKCKWKSCKQLKEDGSEVEDYFEDVFKCLKKDVA